MITYAELSELISHGTQDSFSDRYRPAIRIGAMNAAVDRACTAMRHAMANRSVPEEALREITKTRIFQTNSQGGVNLNDPTLGHDIWSVLAVYARPITVPDGTISGIPDYESQYRPDLTFSGTQSPVERITLEEVPLRRNNTLLNGNEVLAALPKRATFAYYIIGDASSTGYASAASELRVIPQSITGRKLIGISYAMRPSRFVDTTSTVEFPKSMLRVLGDWALESITIPQGDGNTIHGSAAQDAALLFGFMTN